MIGHVHATNVVPGKYCLPEFLRSQKHLRDTIGKGVNFSSLDAVCTVCVQAYVNLIREFGAGDDFIPDEPNASSLSRGQHAKIADWSPMIGRVRNDGTRPLGCEGGPSV